MRWIFVPFFIFFLSFAAHAGLPMRPPDGWVKEGAISQPPEKNPHPPQSEADRGRVDFAVAEIQKYYGAHAEIRHPHIVPWSFQRFLKNQQSSPAGNPASTLTESTPQGYSGRYSMDSLKRADLKPDEYIVHAYVKFPQAPVWYNVDVVMSEDGSGHLVRRNISIIPTDSFLMPAC